MTAPGPHRLQDRLAQASLCVVVTISILRIFLPAGVSGPASGLGLMAGGAMAVYFLLTWRRFGIATWVPVGLSLGLFALALWRGLSWDMLMLAIDRMAFLASLLALLGVLRIVALEAPEVLRAGRYLTAQPPGRRYLALNLGGHMFGVLINMGGMAILLDMARRAVAEGSGHLSASLKEWKLRRMTTAVIRGFALVSLWAPFGFGMNILLLAMPGLDYMQVGPAGFAASFLFVGVGWLLDRLQAPRAPPGQGRGAGPDPADRGAVGLLLCHVGGLGGLTVGLNSATGLSFQQALLLALPVYALGWAGWRGKGAIRASLGAAIARFPASAGEIGVFASAGFLSVLALGLMPVDPLRAALAAAQVTPWQAVLGMNLTLFALGSVGINPIISASVLGGMAAELALPGLSLAAVALSLGGAWSCVIGFTPFITTVVYAGALIDRPAVTVGLRWNGLYSLTMLGLWTGAMMAAVAAGIL